VAERRKAARITAWACSTHITVGCESPTWRWVQQEITLDEAHRLIEAPLVVVHADQFESPSLFRGTSDAIETGWFVYALGLIEDDAQDAVDQAMEALRADIAAGNVAKGTHRHWTPRNPLEPAVEAELRACRESVLRELERGA